MSALARSTAQTTAVLILRILTQAVSLVVSARLLGPEHYGSYVAATALAVVVGIVPCFGSGYVMLARSEPGPEGVSAVWRYAWPLSLALGLALAAIYVPAAFVLGGSHRLSLSVLCVIAFTELVIAPIGILLGSTLQAMHQVPLSQIGLWVTLAMRTAFIVPLLLLDLQFDMLTFVCLQAIAASLGLLFLAALAQKHVKLSDPPRLASLSQLKQGGSYALMHLLAANSSELDKVVATSVVGGHAAGIYSATARVIGAALTPISALLLSAQPQLFQYRQGTRQGMTRLLAGLGVAALAWGAVAYTVLALASPVIASAFGPKYEEVAKFLPLLAIVVTPLALRISAGTVLVAIGKPSTRIALELTGAITLVCLMSLWGPNYGIYGLAVALGVTELAMALGGWWLIRQIFNSPN